MGKIVLKPKTGSIMDLRGIVMDRQGVAFIEEMNETIAQGWAGQLTFDD